ncbi:uncharacterized protein LOC62_04G005249 [Vanrija pseudolonga]|uniref:Uncharacterized protein n=1 Tax=Vanrija pseudolonga TaxID=143232 RepID=A0AAF0YDX1_9TREE|nr:hypothetical protein LOC62_04G005249 [Vanrija pseudolonga]
MVDYLALHKLWYSPTVQRKVLPTDPLQDFLTHPLDMTAAASIWKTKSAARRLLNNVDGCRHAPVLAYYHLLVIPHSIRRYVLHVSLNQLQGDLHSDSYHLLTARSRDHDMKKDVRFSLPTGLAQLVLVLWPYFSATDSPRNKLWLKEPFPQVPKTLICLLWAAATTAQSGTVTIVNADRLSPLLFGQDQERADDPDEVLNKGKRVILQQLGCIIDGQMSHLLDSSLFEQRVDEAFKRIRFVSLETWWDELGDTSRRYEGLALGANKLDGNEAYSLHLVEQ